MLWSSFFLWYNLDRKIYTPTELKSFCKNKNLGSFLAIFAFATIAGFLFFGNVSNVSADGVCNYTSSILTGIPEQKTVKDKAECDAFCKNDPTIFKCSFTEQGGTPFANDPKTTQLKNTNFVKEVLIDNIFVEGVQWLLERILGVVGLLLSGAATLFAWAVDVNNLKNILDNKSVIYPVWQIVRDFLNIAFILVLLYSAFCTILQIENYNYKKILLKLVIMALLVNFSFPITRFVIDISNTLMYTIISTLMGSEAGKTLGIITNYTGIDAILTPTANAPVYYLIAAIIFSFILAVTLLAVAILLTIRIIALAILIIFSPLAFVATIFPDTGSYSSKWWDNLFKYSFFGPIMVFIIYIAARILTQMGNTQTLFKQMALKESVDGNMIGSMAFFAIPIVLLWMGMGIAQSMSIAGAATVMGGAQKFIGKVGKFVGKAPFKGAWWGMKKTGVPEGAKQRWAQFKRTGVLGSEETEKRGAWFSEKFGVKGAVNEQRRKAIQAKREEIKKQGGMEESELEDMLSKGGVSAQAAALELAEKHGFKDYDKYKRSRNILEQTNDKSLTGAFDDFTKKKRIDFVISYKMEHPDKDKTAGDMVKDILDKTSSADYKNIDFKALFKQSGETAKNATQEYFKDLAPGKKADIAKNLRKESMAEVKNMFGAIKRTADEIKKEEEKKHDKFTENFTKNM